MAGQNRSDAAFNAAVAVVTCLINGDRLGAQGVAYDCDLMQEEMVMILAGALAAGHTQETWQAAIMAAHREVLEDEA